MSAMQLAQHAYQSSGAPTKTQRSGEYDTLARVTSRLRLAVDQGNFNQLAAAIDTNRRMWTTIAASVSDAQNSLPDEMKASLFYLSEFTNVHSRKVLTDGEDASALIDVNLAVMRGLNAVGPK